MYSLTLKTTNGDSQRGPLTRAECRAEVEALGEPHWCWRYGPDGSHLAVAQDGRTLAEAVQLPD